MRFTDSMEEDVKVRYQKSRKMSRLSIFTVSTINQNLLIILVGITLSFTSDCVLGLSSMKFSDGRFDFCVYAIIVMFWVTLSIAQISHTIRFVILQNELPIANIKDRDFQYNEAARFLLTQREREIRRLSVLLILIIVFFLVIVLLMVIRFLDLNEWIDLSGFVKMCSYSRLYYLN